MQLNGSYIFDADQKTVWSTLMNPDAIAQALPGIKELVPLEGEDMAWRAAAKVNMPALNGNYAGVIRVSDVDAPNQYRLTINGEGQQSIIGGTALIKLSYNPDKKQTQLNWDGEATISTSTPANIVQQLVGAGATMMSKQFFQGIAKQLPTE
jgi:carbon monoxide dehydrogenase subunit G